MIPGVILLLLPLLFLPFTSSPSSAPSSLASSFRRSALGRLLLQRRLWKGMKGGKEREREGGRPRDGSADEDLDPTFLLQGGREGGRREGEREGGCTVVQDTLAVFHGLISPHSLPPSLSPSLPP